MISSAEETKLKPHTLQQQHQHTGKTTIKKPPKIISSLNIGNMITTTNNRLTISFSTIDELINYLYNETQKAMNNLSLWLQKKCGCSTRMANFLTQFIMINLLLLIPLILSTLVFTSVLIFFSISFILAAIFTSLTVVIIVISICLFTLLAIIGCVTAVILGVTAFMALVFSAIALLVTPIIASIGLLHYLDLSYFKSNSNNHVTNNNNSISSQSAVTAETAKTK